MIPTTADIDRILPSLIRFYEDLHAHPELSQEELVTSGKIGGLLRDAGIQVTERVGGHGLVALIGDGTSPVVMLRADMDALPVTEQTGLSYASSMRVKLPGGQETGIMHACGHDIHVTVLAGTALLMNTRIKKGTVMLVFQPSEETVSGARAMLDDGLYTRFFTPDYAIALHVDPVLPAGTVATRQGVFSSGAESIDIIVHGVGGHAAYPEKTRDPVVLAASLVTALQTIVSREVSPREFCVVTVGSFRGGTKHNLIPDRVDLAVNLRYYRKEVRDRALSSIDRIARNTALAYGLPEDLLPEVTLIDEGVPPLTNDPGLTRKVQEFLKAGLGEENVMEIPPLSGSEDFGFFGQTYPPVPLCYFRLGSYSPALMNTVPEGDRPPLHSPFFVPDPEPTIRTGILAFSLLIAGLTEEVREGPGGAHDGE
jgi:hippurate hydrolase